MNNLFNFSPLFFFNLANFINNRDIFADPTMQQYASGLGYDRRDTGFTSGLINQSNMLKVPQWMANYFREPIQKRLQFPIFLQGIGVPTASLANAQKAAGSDNSGLAQLFASKQPAGLMSILESGQTLNPTPEDANKYIEFTKNALLYAAGAHSIWDAQDSVMKREGVDKDNQIGGVYSNVQQGSDPSANYREASGKYREHLAQIIPFAEKDKMFQLINFAHGLSSDGQDNNKLYENQTQQRLSTQMRDITETPATRGDRRQVLFDAVSTQIKSDQNLPIQAKFQSQSQFMGGQAAANKFYVYEGKARSLSRFAQP